VMYSLLKNLISKNYVVYLGKLSVNSEHEKVYTTEMMLYVGIPFCVV